MTDQAMPQNGRHLRDHIMVVRERKWLVITCFLIVVGVGALITYLQDTVYRADTKVELQVQAPNPLGNIDEGTQPSRSVFFKESYFQTQFEKIRSRDLLTQVMQEHQLSQISPFDRSEDPVGLLQGMIDLDILPNTDVISIAIEWRDPETAALLANAISETYVKWNVERRIDTLLKTQDSLQESLQSEIEQYGDATTETYEKVRQTGRLTPELQQSLAADKLRDMESALGETKDQIRKAEAVLNQAQRAIQQPGLSLSLTGITGNEVLANLSERRARLVDELEAARSVYRDSHPEVQGLKEQLAQLTRQIASTLEGHLDTLRNQRNRQERALREEKGLILQIAQETEPLRGAEIQKESREKLLETISGRLEEISMLATQDLLVNQAQIIERARPPAVPIRPNVKMNMAVALVLGLMVGLGAAFFLDYLDVSVKSVEDLEQDLGCNVLCTIPTRNKKTLPLAQEGIQSLRTALIFADKAKPTHTVLFTSATPKEGKSTTISELARTLSAGGKRTVLLDCDFRLPTLPHIFEIPRDKGIATYVLDEEESWRDHVQREVLPNLDVFPTGPLPPNPTDLLVSPRLTTLLQLLSREYDWVLIDSPPVTSMSDAVLLADRVDGVVFVVKYDHVDKKTVARSLASLESVGARILGVVLNAVDPKKPGYRDYFYGRYAYYGEARRSSEGEAPSLQSVSGGKG